MTAITPAYAHALQLICLTRHIPVVTFQKFRLPSAKARYPPSPQRSYHNTRKRQWFQGWAVHTDGCTRLADGETLAGWSAVARSHHGRMDIMFGPVITAEAHPAFAGARAFQ